MRQQAVTLEPGISGRLMVSDILPVIMASNDMSHDSLQSTNIPWNDPKRYVRDFRTIRLDMGQRSGKTYAIGVMAKPGDLVIDMTYSRVRHIHVADGVHRIGLFTFNRLSCFPVYKTIWLADFNLWPRTSMKEIREKLITSFDQRIIILG